MQFVADNQVVDLDLMVGAIITDASGRFRRQFEKRLDRADVASRARSSSTCPIKTRTVITAAALK